MCVRGVVSGEGVKVWSQGRGMVCGRGVVSGEGVWKRCVLGRLWVGGVGSVSAYASLGQINPLVGKSFLFCCSACVTRPGTGESERL